MSKLQVGEKVVGNANLYYLKCRHDDLCLQPLSDKAVRQLSEAGHGFYHTQTTLNVGTQCGSGLPCVREIHAQGTEQLHIVSLDSICKTRHAAL
jgi:bacterioferritin-associated ferredoxin